MRCWISSTADDVESTYERNKTYNMMKKLFVCVFLRLEAEKGHGPQRDGERAR